MRPPFWRRIPGNWKYALRIFARRPEDDIDAELRFHFDERIAELAGQGLSPDAARARAYEEFGDVEAIRTRLRDIGHRTVLRRHRADWWESVAQDLRYAVRGLGRSPGFTAAVVVTIALGVGTNAALFGVIDRMMFRPPAYLRDPGRVSRVYEYSLMFGRRDIPVQGMTHARYENIERAARSFDRVAGVAWGTLTVTNGADARKEPVSAVTAGYFDFFDARPAQGRFIGAGDDSGPTGAPVVVVSHAYWRDHFGARSNAVGTSLVIDSVTRTVIGVAPEGFAGIADDAVPALWIPMGSRSSTRMIVQRKRGLGGAAASADLTHAIQLSYEAERAINPHMMPIDVARPTASAVSLFEMRRPDAPPEAKLLPWLGAVGLIVLLIACANVANLLLARALSRRREIAVRLALGISRRRLLSQLLTESTLLAAIGGLGGLITAHWGATVLHVLLTRKDPTIGTLTIPSRAAVDGGNVAVMTDGRTLVFGLCAVLVVGMLSGLAPAAHALRQDLTSSMKSGVREGGYQRSRTRTALLVSQVALSAALLVGAGLFVRSLAHLRTVRLGYDVDPVLTVNVDMRGTKLADSTTALLMRHLETELATIPGVTGAAQASTFSGWIAYEQLSIPGVVSTEGQFLQLTAGPGYFATVGSRILRGRAFAAADGADAPLVAIVSRAMAHALWPDEDAIGRCIRLAARGRGPGDVDPAAAPCRTVVGIAEDIKQKTFVGDPGLQYYLPIAQYPGGASLVIRVNGDASHDVETIRRRLQALMPGTSEVTVMPLRDQIDAKMRPWRLGATLFLVFGGLALTVAAVGLFAVISYNVEQRSRELGVRIAFGAESADVLRLVVGEAMRFALVGIVIGAGVSLGVGHWLRPLLFAESPGDPAVYAVVAAVLFAVALAASARPALRATGTDPNLVLRSE